MRADGQSIITNKPRNTKKLKLISLMEWAAAQFISFTNPFNQKKNKIYLLISFN